MPMPMPMPTRIGMTIRLNGLYSYLYGHNDKVTNRESLQTAALNKIRHRLTEIIQIGQAKIDSFKKAEQDLINGGKKIDLLINEI